MTAAASPGDAAPAGESGPSPAWGLLAAVLLLATLFFPLGRDQAIFAYVAETIVRGGMPYRDAWDLKPPGIYLLYALPVLASAGRPEALGFWIRACDVSAAGATGVLLCVLAARLGAPRAGPAAACWYAALYFATGFWSLGQAEAWANLPAVAAAALLLPAVGGAPGRRAAVAAGALAACAAACKYTTILPLLAVVVVRLRCKSLSLPALAWVGMGGLLAAALAAAWLGCGAALAEYLAIQREFVAPYSRLHADGLQGWAERLLVGTLRWGAGVFVPLVLAVFGWAARRVVVGSRASRASTLLGGALLAGVAAVWLQNKYFAYHWQTALPWLALLAAWAGMDFVDSLAQRATRPRRWLPAVNPAIAILWLIAAQWPALSTTTAVAAGALPRHAYLERFADRADFSAAEIERVSAAVRARTRPGDPILVWGWDAGIYLQSGRRAPTRFFFNQPLVSSFAPARWRDEFLASFDAASPALIAVARRDETPWAKGRADDSLAQLRAWREFSARVDRRYAPAGAEGDYLLFLRKEGR